MWYAKRDVRVCFRSDISGSDGEWVRIHRELRHIRWIQYNWPRHLRLLKQSTI